MVIRAGHSKNIGLPQLGESFPGFSFRPEKNGKGKLSLPQNCETPRAAGGRALSSDPGQWRGMHSFRNHRPMIRISLINNN